MDGLCRPRKDTAIEAFLPARTELDPGRIPRGTQTPAYFTRHILPPKKESTGLSCISKANRTLVFSLPKKDHVGSAHHWSRKKKIDVSRKHGTDKPWKPIGEHLSLHSGWHGGKFYHLLTRPGFLAPGCIHKPTTVHIPEPLLCVKHCASHMSCH